LGATIGAVSVVSSWSDWSRMRTASDLGAAFDRMLGVPERIQGERSMLTRLLTTAEPSAADRTALTEARRLTDQAFEDASASVTRLSGGFVAEIQRGLTAMRGDMQTLRGRADPVQQLP